MATIPRTEAKQSQLGGLEAGSNKLRSSKQASPANVTTSKNRNGYQGAIHWSTTKTPTVKAIKMAPIHRRVLSIRQ